MQKGEKSRKGRGNKKGLSTIIVTLIIILISLVAVGIIWIVVRNVIQAGTEGIAFGQFMLNAKILDAGVDDNISNNISLIVKRNAGQGELVGMKFVFSDGKNSEIITEEFSLNELEQRGFTFHLINLNASNIETISIYPLIKQEEKQVTGGILDKYAVGTGKKTPTCSPTNCSILGYLCGTWGNGSCSGTLDCGSCSGGQTCNASGRCSASCASQTCASLGYQCGSGYANGTCGGTLNCGTCSGGQTCNASGRCEILQPVYWVSPTGTASWFNCYSATPLDGTAACNLTIANANAQSGNFIYLRGGIYRTHIFPANSGTISQKITYVNYLGETVVINNDVTTYATYYYGILLTKNYIKISGIIVDSENLPSGKYRPLSITSGGSYNEIDNCIIDGNNDATIQIWDGISIPSGGIPCTNNWIHNSVIKNTGYVNSGCNDINGMQIGVPSYDNDSNYNTIENNLFYCGGHHNLETFTKYNVIRNNSFHHEGCMTPPSVACVYGADTNGLYGNRNFQLYDGYNENKYTLVEGNRFGTSGPAPDDDGGDGLTITAPRNIIRYNSIFNSQNNGVLFKTGTNSYSDNNRFYANTLYNNGRYRNTGPQWQGANFRWYGSYARIGNVIKNNLLYNYNSGAGDWYGGSATIYSDNNVSSNWCTDANSGKCIGNGNPLFVNPDVSNPESLTLPDLSLQPGSGAIDMGAPLTFVAVADTGSGSLLILEDSMYFQDGSWGSSLSDIQPDWIAIGTTNNIAQISSIDYSTNNIILTSSISRSDGDPVWLYKKSDGTKVLYGSAPDFGAYEYI